MKQLLKDIIIDQKSFLPSKKTIIRSFSEKYLNTSLKGKITQINYNNYDYSNIVLDGNFKSGLYKGQVSVKDPNLKMNFDGLVDVSKKESRYDFHINVENADLKKLKFVNDSISHFQGDAVVEVTGNSIENLQGNIYIKDAVFQNPNALIVGFDPKRAISLLLSHSANAQDG